jgi:hypothetical protein
VTQVVIVLLGPTGVPFNGTANLSWVGWVADIGNFMSGTWSASCSATYPEGGIGVGPTISFFVP